MTFEQGRVYKNTEYFAPLVCVGHTVRGTPLLQHLNEKDDARIHYSTNWAGRWFEVEQQWVEKKTG